MMAVMAKPAIIASPMINKESKEAIKGLAI